MIELGGCGDRDAAIHEYVLPEGIVIYFIGAGRNGWDDRRAQIFFHHGEVLKYFGIVRISSKLNEKIFTRADLVQVVVENDEEVFGEPYIEEDQLMIPFRVFHHNRSKTLISEKILAFPIDQPERSVALG